VRQNVDLVLFLAGRGETEYETWMREEITRLGITENVRWLGFLEGDKNGAHWQAVTCW
jgi:phage anti-repressor protein